MTWRKAEPRRCFYCCWMCMLIAFYSCLGCVTHQTINVQLWSPCRPGLDLLNIKSEINKEIWLINKNELHKNIVEMLFNVMKRWSDRSMTLQKRTSMDVLGIEIVEWKLVFNWGKPKSCRNNPWSFELCCNSIIASPFRFDDLSRRFSWSIIRHSS